jgi:hypothetical protein
MQRMDAGHVLRQAALTTGSVLLVPSRTPRPELDLRGLPAVVRLTEVLSWKEPGFDFDLAHIEDELRALAPARTMPKPAAASKRASRLKQIELLKAALLEHLRSARDHAYVTRKQSGSAVLLPRPSQQFLARQTGISKATVSRCFDDPAAGELRRLWEAADDLDRLVT